MALPAVGIFVGGAGRRMGGVAKGLLMHEGQPLVERLPAICREAAVLAARGAELPLFLIGNALAYAASPVPKLEDQPAGIGPIGGLRALLLRAQAAGIDAIAVAVDLPHLDAGVLLRLYCERPQAVVLAPRQAGRWQPLLARYRPAVVLPVVDAAIAGGHTSLQTVFAHLDTIGCPAEELALSDAERRVLHDWDCPDDMLSSSALRAHQAKSQATPASMTTPGSHSGKPHPDEDGKDEDGK